MAPSQPHTLQTTKLAIHYEVSGPETGIPVILLHGWPYSPRQYDALITHLHDTHPQTYRIYLPTLRGFSPTSYTSAAVPRSGQQAAIAQDLIDFITGLSIRAPILVGYDWGGRAACIVAALQPDLVRGLVSCNGYAVQDIARAATVPTSPEQAKLHWYQFYLHTETGRAGFEQKRGEFARFLWKTWSPNWAFSDEEFEEAAKAFDGPDWVETTVSSYRHRYGNAQGDPGLEGMEAELARQPKISVPTVVVAGKANGVEPVADADVKRGQFTGFYARWLLDKVGHCVPAEAPAEVARAVDMLVRETGG